MLGGRCRGAQRVVDHRVRICDVAEGVLRPSFVLVRRYVEAHNSAHESVAAPWRCEAREVAGLLCQGKLVVAFERVECGEELLAGLDLRHDVAGSVQREVRAGRVLVELREVDRDAYPARRFRHDDHGVHPWGVMRNWLNDAHLDHEVQLSLGRVS